MSCECDTKVFKVLLLKKMFFPLSYLYVLFFFSLAAVLHVEGQNVYFPKISNMAASRESPLSHSAGSDLNSSSQGSGSLCPSSQYVHGVGREQECGSSFPPL